MGIIINHGRDNTIVNPWMGLINVINAGKTMHLFPPMTGNRNHTCKNGEKTCEDILLTSINSGDIPWYLVLLLYCYTFDPPAQQQYINDFPLTYTFKTSTRKLLQISRLEVQKKLPSKPLMQNSEFKTGASLSSISVAFHGEVIVEN